MARFKSVKLPNLPPFTGGAVGYFGYDMVRTIEDIPQSAVDDLGVDDAVLMFYKTVLAFDHLRHQIHIISNILVDDSHDPIDAQYEKAVAEIQRIEALLRAPLEMPPVTRNETDVTVRSNFERGSICSCRESEGIHRRRRHFSGCIGATIRSGSADGAFRDLSRTADRESFALHVLSQDAGDVIVGSSPEMLVRVRDREHRYRPIAGTRPRGASDRKTNERRESCATTKKNGPSTSCSSTWAATISAASRNTEPCEVEELMFIERYSHVMHLVSSLRGRTARGR